MIESIKKKWKILIFVLILLLGLIFTYMCLKMINHQQKEYKNDYFKIKYDSTWKVDSNDPFTLIHKKSKGTLTISYKKLSDDLINTSLSSIINNVIYSLEDQNKDYKLLSKDVFNSKYDSYQLLYEKEDKQCLVYVLKKDNILVFITYNADSDYFDIVLDSVDSIVDKLEIYSGEK